MEGSKREEMEWGEKRESWECRESEMQREEREE